jgi:hypothetical protein
MKYSAFFLPLALLGLFLLTSCGFIGEKLRLPQFATEAASPRAQDKAKTVKPKASTVPPKSPEKIAATRKPAFDRKAVNVLLEKDDFAEALLVIGRDIKRGVPEQEMAAEYLQVLNGAIAKGQSLLAENDPGQAGLLFRAVLDGYPKDASLAAGASLRPAELEAILKNCADKLMEKGIVSYRSGNLGQAIDIWNEVLVFCPQHQSCQKAIQTANTQLANLEKLTTD